MKFYFTFGSGQPNEGGYHIINAPTDMEARKKMCERFGQKWAMVYTESQWMGADFKTQAERYGLYEVK